MISMQRGMRGKIGQIFDPAQDIVLQLQTDGQAIYDYSCFGVDSAGKLSDDRYMIFYNQTESPERAVSYAENAQGAVFRVRLSTLPPTIDKLVFTVSIDGAGTMQEIRSHLLTVSQNGTEQLRLSLQGTDFRAERAIVLFEIYRKGEWRYAAVASGFDGGLADLLRFFGGEEVTEQTDPEPEETASVFAADEITANTGNSAIPAAEDTPQSEDEPVKTERPEPEAAFPEPEETVSVSAADEIAANAGNTAIPAAEDAPQSEDEPVKTEHPEPEAAFPEPEETVSAPAAPHSFPEPIRIPPPVIPPPVITPPVIPVPLCRTAEKHSAPAERDVLAEIQQAEDITTNE